MFLLFFRFWELMDYLTVMFATVYIIPNTCCLCDAMTCLLDVNKYGEVDFMSIVMSDDDMLLCGLYVLSHIHFISEEGFYAKR